MVNTMTSPRIPEPATPGQNPLPWLTDVWNSGGCFATPVGLALSANGGKVIREAGAFSPEVEALTAMIDTVRSTVAGLSDDPTHVYNVEFVGDGIGATSWERRLVSIGSKALTSGESQGRVAAIMSGIALHEVMHIRISQTHNKGLERVYGKADPTNEAYLKAHSVGNTIDDVFGESIAAKEFPGLAPAIDVAMWFVWENEKREFTAKGGVLPSIPSFGDPKERAHMFLTGMRYPWAVDWSTAEAEYTMIREWHNRALALKVGDNRDYLALVADVLAWIDNPSLNTPEQEQPGEGEGEGGEGEGEGEPNGSGNGQPGNNSAKQSNPFDKGKGKGKGNPTEGEGNGQGQGDKPGQGQGQGQGQQPTKGEGDLADLVDGTIGAGTGGVTANQRTGTAEGDTSAIKRQNVVLELPDCLSEGNRDEATDKVAQGATVSHAKARRDVSRIRRYPNSMPGGNPVVVRRRTIAGGAGSAKWDAPNLWSEADDDLDDDAWDDDIEDMDSEALAKAWGAIDDPNRASKEALANTVQDLKTRTGKMTVDRPEVGRQLAAVINSARKGPGLPQRFQRTGRIDRTRLSRVAVADPHVFTRNVAPSPQRVRAYILVDCSGSMSGPKGKRAAQTARDLANAIDQIDWASGAIYGHTTDSFGVYVARVWNSGENRKFVDDIYSLPKADNHDGYAVAYVCDDILEEKTREERGVVMVISDGLPTHYNGYEHTKEVVDFYRRQGLRVMGISIDAAASGTRFASLYGGDVIDYDPNTAVFARNMARVIGSSI